MTTDVLNNQSQSHDHYVTANFTFEPGKSRPPSTISIESVDSVVYNQGLKEELKEVWPLKCVYPVLEILHTEEAYVKALEEMVKGYRDPLSNWLQSSKDGETFITNVFSNLGQLFDTHTRLLQCLKDSATDPREFGQVFVKAEEGFAGYTEYCTNFNTATELLRQTTEANTDLREFLEICQHQLQHNLPLDAQLIKPVQRILKYRLLLLQVLKNFNTEHHAHPSLRGALSVMVKTAAHINDVKRQMENSIRVKEIQQSLCGGPSRKLTSYGELIHECKCKVHVGKKGAERERELFLFDKLLLLLKKKDSKRYNYKGHIEGGELRLDEVASEPAGFRVFSEVRPTHTYLILVRSEKVKLEWVEKIREIIKFNAEIIKKKRQEMSLNMKKMRYSSNSMEPRTIPASDRTHRIIGDTERGRRKRKTLSDIFPTFNDRDDVAQLRKVSRINPDSNEDMVDGWVEEGGGERVSEVVSEERLSGRGQDDSGIALPPISEEEGSIFSQPGNFLQPNRYTGTKSKMSASVSMESLVSLSDVEIEDEKEEEDRAGHVTLGGRYVEDYDYGGDEEGEREGEEEREKREGQKIMIRQTSNLRRKPAIRVKTRNPTSPSTGSKFIQRSALIREKAQMARAESYAVSGKENEPLSGEITSDGLSEGDTIGTAGSLDTSISGTTALTNGFAADPSSKELDSTTANVSSGGVHTIVTSHEETETGQEEGVGASVVPLEEEPVCYGGLVEREGETGEGSAVPLTTLGGEDGAGDGTGEIEIVDSSDSEEEEEEEDGISSGSLEDDLGSSLEHPLTRRQQSNSGSHDDQSTEQRQLMTDEVLLSDTHSAGPDSNLTSMGMEDSGFRTGSSASWNFMENRVDPEIADSEGDHQLEEVFTSDFRTKSIEHYATMPRDKIRKYTARSQLPVPPQTLIIPRDFSPGPHSHKSSSPSSTSSSISRTTKGFSRLIEFTRKLSTPPYSDEGDQISQSVPPGGFTRDILEEPSIFSDDLFPESLTDDVQSVETPPPAKKPALDLPPSLEDGHVTPVDEPPLESAIAVETATSTTVEEVTIDSELPANDGEVAMETQNADQVSMETQNVGEVSMETSDIAIETKSPQSASDVAVGRVTVEQPIICETCEDAHTVGDEQGVVEGVADTEKQAEDVPVVLSEGASADINVVVESIADSEKQAEDVPVVLSEGASADINGVVGSIADSEKQAEDVPVVLSEGASAEQLELSEGASDVEMGIRDKEVDGAQVKSNDVVERERMDEASRENDGREVPDTELMAPQVLENTQVVLDHTVEIEPTIVPAHTVPWDNYNTTQSVFSASINTDSTASSITTAVADVTYDNTGNVQANIPEDVGQRESFDLNSSQDECISEESLAELQEIESMEQYIEQELTNAERDRALEDSEERVRGEDEELVAEHQLTHRYTQASECVTALNLLSADTTASTAQATTPVSLFRALHRRFREWRVGNRRFLMFGFGVLTVASLLFLGVNFLYDTANDAQTKRPAALH